MKCEITSWLLKIIPMQLSLIPQKQIHITIVTGTLIENVFNIEIIPILSKIKNLSISLVPVINNFFGNSVTVSGLLTGKDIIEALNKVELGDEIWMSHRVLNDSQTLTLDDLTILDIERELGCTVRVSNDSFLELIININNE